MSKRNTVNVDSIVAWGHYICSFTNGKKEQLAGIRSYPIVEGKDEEYYKDVKDILYQIGSFVSPALFFNHPDPRDPKSKYMDSGTLSFMLNERPEAEKALLLLNESISNYLVENMDTFAYHDDRDPHFKRAMREQIDECFKKSKGLSESDPIPEEMVIESKQFVASKYYKGPIYNSPKSGNVFHLTYSKAGVNSDYRVNDRNENVKTIRIPVLYFDPETKEKNEIGYENTNSPETLGSRFNGVVGFTIGPLYFGGTIAQSLRMMVKVTNIVKLPGRERDRFVLSIDDLMDEYNESKGDVSKENTDGGKEETNSKRTMSDVQENVSEYDDVIDDLISNKRVKVA